MGTNCKTALFSITGESVPIPHLRRVEVAITPGLCVLTPIASGDAA